MPALSCGPWVVWHGTPGEGGSKSLTPNSWNLQEGSFVRTVSMLRGPKDHINMRILQTMVSGSPGVLLVSVGPLCLCGLLEPSSYSLEAFESMTPNLSTKHCTRLFIRVPRHMWKSLVASPPDATQHPSL